MALVNWNDTSNDARTLSESYSPAADTSGTTGDVCDQNTATSRYVTWLNSGTRSYTFEVSYTKERAIEELKLYWRGQLVQNTQRRCITLYTWYLDTYEGSSWVNKASGTTNGNGAFWATATFASVKCTKSRFRITTVYSGASGATVYRSSVWNYEFESWGKGLPSSWARIGGAWKEITAGWVRIGGAWKEIQNIEKRIGGSWKT
jgi:hypothetical protein